MIFHIPHSSTVLAPDTSFSISAAELEHELLVMTDHFTDDLFAASLASDDVAVIATTSRLVVDVERFPDDADESMAARGMGVIYTKCSNLRALRPTPSAAEREQLLNRYYWPHHQALEQAVKAQLEKNRGFATILDCHSFPSQPLPYEPDQTADRPDICIGTDSFHTADHLCALVSDLLKNNGYTVAVNTPYSGSIVPATYYRKPHDIDSIMIEVNRRLYMDERTGKKETAGYEQIKSVLSQVAQLLRDYDDCDHNTGEMIQELAEYVASVEWDSGGPGAGAGRDDLYRLDDRFYWFHDAGVSVLNTFAEVVDNGFFEENEATAEMPCIADIEAKLKRTK